MTMTKVDPECSRNAQSGRKPYFDSSLISSLCFSEAMTEREIWNFGSFAALPLETLVAKYYIKMSLINAGTPQLQFDALLDFWIVNWKLINRYHFSCFLSYSIFPLILSCCNYLSSREK